MKPSAQGLLKALASGDHRAYAAAHTLSYVMRHPPVNDMGAVIALEMITEDMAKLLASMEEDRG